MSGTFSALLSKVTGVSTLGIQRLFDLASLLSIGEEHLATLILAGDLKVEPSWQSNACPAGAVQIHL